MYLESEQQRMARRIIKRIADENALPVAHAFSNSLSGDVARFRLLRELRKKYKLSTCELLIEMEATP